MAAREAIWLARLLADIHQQTSTDTITVCFDSNGAKDLAQNATILERTEHIHVQYHFFRRCVQEGRIKLDRCDTASQTADPLTKSLDKIHHQKLRNMKGLRKGRTVWFEEDC